jgi:hypothetical protein
MRNNITTRNTEISRKNKWSSMFTNPIVLNWVHQKWATINQRTVNGKYAYSHAVSNNPQQKSYLKHGIRIEMTQVEFYTWASNHEKTIFTMINLGEKPQIDRRDNDKHYSIDNIQLVSQRVGSRKDRTTNPNPRKHNNNPLLVELKNRQVYIRNVSNVKERYVDKFINTNYRFIVRDVAQIISNGNFPHYNEYVDPINDYSEELKNVMDILLNNEKEQLEAMKAKVTKKEAKRLEVQKKKEDAAARKLAEETYHADKAFAKAHPDYEMVYAICLKNARQLKAKDITPQMATIEIIKKLSTNPSEISDLVGAL